MTKGFYNASTTGLFSSIKGSLLRLYGTWAVFSVHICISKQGTCPEECTPFCIDDFQTVVYLVSKAIQYVFKTFHKVCFSSWFEMIRILIKNINKIMYIRKLDFKMTPRIKELPLMFTYGNWITFEFLQCCPTKILIE